MPSQLTRAFVVSLLQHPASRLDLGQPQDHVAIALAPPAHGGQAVSDSRLDPNPALALYRLEGFGGDGDADHGQVHDVVIVQRLSTSRRETPRHAASMVAMLLWLKGCPRSFRKPMRPPSRPILLAD